MWWVGKAELLKLKADSSTWPIFFLIRCKMVNWGLHDAVCKGNRTVSSYKAVNGGVNREQDKLNDVVEGTRGCWLWCERNAALYKTTTWRKKIRATEEDCNTLAGGLQQGLHASGDIAQPWAPHRANLQVQPSAKNPNILKASAWSNGGYARTAR